MVFFTTFFGSKYKPYLLLVLVPLLLYKKSLLFGFSPMDEQWMIEENGWFLSDWHNLKAVFTGPTALQIYYRPLFVALTMLDYHIGRLDPFIYHLSSVLLHTGCVLLLFKFLVQCKVSRQVAFFMALVFAVHPVFLQAVAWIPGSNDSMLCLFVLASLICLNNYNANRKISAFGGNILFFICALFTKENAVVLPFVYMLVMYTGQKNTKKQLVVSACLWLIISLCWFILRKNFVDKTPKIDIDFLVACKNTILALLVSIGKTLFPIQQSVFPVLRHSSVLPGCVTLVVFVFLWWRFTPTNKPMALSGIFLFFILLIIPLGFSAIKSPGEQYEQRLYAPMVGLLLFFSQLRYNTRPLTFVIAFTSAAACLALATYVKMDVYKDRFSFLDNGISSYPEYYYFYLQKGELLNQKGDYPAAISCFNKALLCNPEKGQIYYNRGNVFFTLGKKENAIADYNMALKKLGLNPQVLMQRCMAYSGFGDAELAMNDLQTLKKCCQEIIESDLEQEVTLKWEIEKWSRKIAAAPADASLYLMRALFFMERYKSKEAMADLQKACSLEPGNSEYRKYLQQASAALIPGTENRK